MSQSFTKLFSSITESTVWFESSNTRIVWITLLAMADQNGEIHASIPGLSQRAVVPLEDTELALQKFMAPDKYSRTKDNDGRRIEEIDGGWRLLNYQKYRELGSREARREQQREWDRKNRSGSRNPTRSDKIRQNPTNPTQAEAEADVDKSQDTAERDLFEPVIVEELPLVDGSVFRFPEVLLKEMQAAYPALDIKGELAKMRAWLIANPTNRKTARGIMRFVNNWLSRGQDRAPPRGNATAPPAPQKSGSGISPPKPREDPLKAGMAHLRQMLEYGQMDQSEFNRRAADLRARFPRQQERA